VLGAEIADCLGAQVPIERVAGDSRRLALAPGGPPSAGLLLILGDGSGVFVPVIREFVASLVFEAGELVDVAYEPAEGTSRWQDFSRRADHLRELRRLVAGAARGGVFHPEAATMAALARQMQYVPTRAGDALVDPALALHAAYALHDLRMSDAIRDIARALTRELSLALFDVALLAGELPAAMPEPPFPMLVRGWALLSAAGAALPDGLEGIQRELLPSLWTHFNPAGASRLRKLMLARSLR
jgi:hypothetical protein